MISIVSPVYRAEKILESLVSEINKVMLQIGEEFELILVDDRSPDGSWREMQRLSEIHSHLKIYRLSRNFGQHATIFAGLSKTKGDWVVVMDCDMQDQPKEIAKLFEKTKEGFEVVLAKRVSRQDSLVKKMGSRIFYKLFNYLAGIKIDHEVANFGIYKKSVIQSALQIGDTIKFFPLFIHWVGYNQIAIPIEHAEREEGSSSYNIFTLIDLAFNAIVSFSDKPLRLFVKTGIIISSLSIIIGVFYTIKYILGDITKPGFASIILSIWFLSGIIISCIGVMGIYMGKTFNQVKNRPTYIIE